MSSGSAPSADSRLLSAEDHSPESHTAHTTTEMETAGHGTAPDTDMYQQLLSQLNDDAGKNGQTGAVPRMMDIRRQLTEFQLHYKFGMDESSPRSTSSAKSSSTPGTTRPSSMSTTG